jgi:DNA anti-recombination protein RmuC
MPDTTIEQPTGGPYDPPLEPRVTRLEENMGDLKAIIARIDAILPHLATAAQVAELRGEIDVKFARFAGEFDTRLERFAGGFDARLERMSGEFDKKLERMSGQFDSKLERMSGQFDSKLERFAGEFDTRLERFAGGFDSRLERFAGDFSARLERLTGRVEALPTTWQMLTAIMAGQITLAGLLAAALFGAARMFGHG